MGRAIVRQPQVFLMDEPLSNLDAKLRVQTRTQIAALQRRLGVTTVYVTHDQVEAMTMGDRVAVLRDGILQQCATPRELFTKPANTFVAGFIGSPAMNMLQCTATPDGLAYGNLHVAARRDPANAALTTDQVTIGVRPEALRIGTEGLEATIVAVEELGSDSFVYCTPDWPPRRVAGRPDRRAQHVATRHHRAPHARHHRRCMCSTPPAVPGSKADAVTAPADQRIDPYLGTVVHVVGARQARPNLPSTGCPFCVGGLEAPDPYEVHWFPNRWPAMQGDRCEVVLYTPDHDATLWSLGVSGVRKVIDLWAERTDGTRRARRRRLRAGVREPRAAGRRDHRPSAWADLRLRPRAATARRRC